MASKQHDLLFKIVLVGDYDVGKQEVLKRFVDNVYHGKYVTTVAVDLTVKVIEFDGKRIKLQLWDTVGNDRYRSLTTPYFRGSQGVIVFYDITKERTFRTMREWCRQVEHYASPDVSKLMLGNRCDQELDREVSKEMGQHLADELGFKFMEVSPKTGLNVDEAFMTLIGDIKSRIDTKGVGLQMKNRQSSVTLGGETVPSENMSGSCCK